MALSANGHISLSTASSINRVTRRDSRMVKFCNGELMGLKLKTCSSKSACLLNHTKSVNRRVCMSLTADFASEAEGKKMEGVTFKVFWNGKSVDLEIQDRDKCLLMDVLNDLLDEAPKLDIALPKYFGLTYYYRGKDIELKNDADLVKMLMSRKQKVMILWVIELKEPNDVWKLAMSLRKSPMGSCNPNQKTMNPSSSVQVRRPKLPIRRSARLTSGIEILSSTPATMEGNGSPAKDIEPSPIAECNASPIASRRSPRFMSSPVKDVAVTTDAAPNKPRLSPKPSRKAQIIMNRINELERECAASIQPEVNQSPIQPEVQLGGPANQPLIQPEVQPGVTVSASSSGVKKAPQGRKMAATTAKRKGIFLSLQRSSSLSNSSPSSVGRNSRTSTIAPVNEVNVSGEQENEDTSNSEDEDYDPGNDEDSHLDEDEDLSIEDEDLSGDDSDFNVSDTYEPNTGHKSQGLWDECEDYFDKMFRNGELYVEEEFGSIQLKPWMLFMDKKHFKMVFVEYCIQEGFVVVVRKADKKRYRAECAAEGCPFRIHASQLPDGFTWAIKALDTTHNCSRVEMHNPMATYKWVAEKLLDDIRANNDISIKSCNHLLYERYGIELRKSTAYVMKDHALKLIHGGHDISYAKLPAYCEILKEVNPGSVAHCAYPASEEHAPGGPERPLVFKYIFISLHAQFEGFIRGCRGLIGVDGTHLKGNYGGVLLSAVAIDGNNELFPIAHAIVQTENTETWSHFFWHLKHTLKDSGRTGWTIISDRQKGVLPALQDMWPEVSRRFCTRHLYMNFKKKYPGPLMRALFFRVVNAYSKHSYNKAMKRIIKEAGLGVAQWFNGLGKKKECWARHMFSPNLKSDENTTNFVESLNSLLGTDRCRPVLTLLEGIRRLHMVRHARRQEIAESWDDSSICPKIQQLLSVISKDSRACRVFKAGGGVFEIQDGNSYLPVSLTNRTCLCAKWQISGIPCKHAVRAIIHNRESPESYVSEWFSVKMYKLAYGLNIHPVPSEDAWACSDLPTIEPPSMKRSIGRPARNRRREEGEKRKGKRSTTVQCKKCKAFGHNSRTCKGGPTAREVRENLANEGLTVGQKRSRSEALPQLTPTEPSTTRVTRARISSSQPEALTGRITRGTISSSQPSPPTARVTKASISSSQPAPATTKVTRGNLSSSQPAETTARVTRSTKRKSDA